MPWAEKYGDSVETSCPSGLNKREPGNLMKTKDRRRRFQKNEPENMLKRSQLPKTAGNPNWGDKLFGQAERGAGRKRFSFASPLRFRTSSTSRFLRFPGRESDPSSAVLRPAPSPPQEGWSILPTGHRDRNHKGGAGRPQARRTMTILHSRYYISIYYYTIAGLGYANGLTLSNLNANGIRPKFP